MIKRLAQAEPRANRSGLLGPDGDRNNGWKDGYRLWVMNYTGDILPASLALLSDLNCDAAVITAVGSITCRGRKASYSKHGQPGRYCTLLYKELTAIRFGDAPDRYGWLRRVPL